MAKKNKTLGLLTAIMMYSLMGSKYFLGGRTKKRFGFSLREGNKYNPHQGKRECARRIKQLERGIIKLF